MSTTISLKEHPSKWSAWVMLFLWTVIRVYQPVL